MPRNSGYAPSKTGVRCAPKGPALLLPAVPDRAGEVGRLNYAVYDVVVPSPDGRTRSGRLIISARTQGRLQGQGEHVREGDIPRRCPLNKGRRQDRFVHLLYGVAGDLKLLSSH